MSEPKQCTLCGRYGTRSFEQLSPGQGGYVCKYVRACRLRRERSFPPSMRVKHT